MVSWERCASWVMDFGTFVIIISYPKPHLKLSWKLLFNYPLSCLRFMQFLNLDPFYVCAVQFMIPKIFVVSIQLYSYWYLFIVSMDILNPTFFSHITACYPSPLCSLPSMCSVKISIMIKLGFSCIFVSSNSSSGSSHS